MTDIARALREEITRLARKEVKAQLASHTKSSNALKDKVSLLRKEAETLHSRIRVLEKALAVTARAEPAVEVSAQPSRQRFTSASLAKLRERLGMSYAKFAVLVRASEQSVRNWEEGVSVPREKYQAAIFSLRTIGKREAQAMLENTSSQ